MSDYGNDPIYSAALEGRLQMDTKTEKNQDGTFTSRFDDYGIKCEFTDQDFIYASQKVVELALEEMRLGKGVATFG